MFFACFSNLNSFPIVLDIFSHLSSLCDYVNLSSHFFSFFLRPQDDLYYCGLRAKQTAQNFAPKEKLTRKTSRANEDQQPIYVSNNRNLSRIPRDPAIKRRSISHVDRHQPTFSSLYQLNQINDPRSSLYQRLHHHSYNMSPGRHYSNNNLGHSGGMWHARSYESGIGM
jgi:hypothetical protein